MNLSKSILLAILLMAVCSTAFSQSENEDAIKRAKMKYNRSVKYNDFAIAKDAIYDLMVLEPNNSSYLDSLAFMYYEFQQYASAALVSRDALNKNSNNKLMLQIGAKSLDELGAIDQSLKLYEKLYAVSDDPFVLYEVIQKQFQLKKYEEAMINTELLLGKPAVDRNNVYIKNEAGEDFEAPFKVMVYNLQGLISRAQGKEDEAKKYFNKALKIAPNYALAKENLNPTKK